MIRLSDLQLAQYEFPNLDCCRFCSVISILVVLAVCGDSGRRIDGLD